MTHEKIFQRKDGSAVKISVWLYVQEKKSNWGYFLWIREPDGDRWIDPFNDSSYLQRSLQNRLKNESAVVLEGIGQYISPKEILQAKLELWKRIKPV